MKPSTEYKLDLANEILEELSIRLYGIGIPIIAGGAIRDITMGMEPKDYDVFLLNTDFTSQKKKVAAALVNLEVVKGVEWHNSEPFLVDTVRFKGVEVQIMCTPCKNIVELLKTFDWNVSLFAYDGVTVYANESIANIASGKSLKLQTITHPKSTLRRGFRFSERFEMVFEHEDIRKLCKAVAAQPVR